MRIEVLMAVHVPITVFWAVTYGSEELTASILYHEDGGTRFLKMVPSTEMHSTITKSLILNCSFRSKYDGSSSVTINPLKTKHICFI
jgi:hypothetical protein